MCQLCFHNLSSRLQLIPECGQVGCWVVPHLSRSLALILEHLQNASGVTPIQLFELREPCERLFHLPNGEKKGYLLWPVFPHAFHKYLERSLEQAVKVLYEPIRLGVIGRGLHGLYSQITP